jgi:uncharacterized membrane protein
VLCVNDFHCSCGMIQEYGMPCVDAMANYQKMESNTLGEIMASNATSEFHKFSYYHDLMKKNMNPVVLDNL